MSLARFLGAVVAMTSTLGGCAAVLSLDSGEPRGVDIEPGPDGSLPPDAGDERTPGPDGACGASTKSCNGACTPESDPSVGCAAPGCDPCASRNAQATQVQTWTCAASGCDIGACVVNYKNCNLQAVDGCEVNGKTDPNHCGDCKTVCPGTAAFCVDGACTSNCDPPNEVCNTTSCIPVKTDPDNCGSCGNKCPPPAGGNATCTDGGCDFTCTSPLVRCDPDGCVDTKTSVKHCGGCSYDCAAHAPPNQMATGCTGGSCTFMCQSGYVDAGGNCVLPGDGGCTPNASGCNPGGNLCSGGPDHCCGCACVGNTCCLETGKPCSPAAGAQCCSGFCNPVAGLDGGTQGMCN